MPNWCENRLVITGPEKAVEKLFEQVEGPDTILDFTKIVPIPEEIRDLNKKTALFPGVYGRTLEGTAQYSQDTLKVLNWQAQNWGTKWNAADAVRESTYNGIDGSSINAFTFNTAWGPPEPIVGALHQQNPDTSLVLFYKEPGMGFAGESSYLNKHDSQLKDWRPGVPENVTYLEGEAYKQAYPEEFIEEDLEEHPTAGQGQQAGEQCQSSTGETSMTTETENKAPEAKKSKRELMAELTAQHITTATGMLDLDSATGNVTAAEGLQEAILLPDVTMDMLKKAAEQQAHTVNVVTAAHTNLAGAAYRLNKELKSTTGHVPTIGKNRVEIDTTRGGDVVIRSRDVSVNDKAGDLKATVTSFADAQKKLADDEAAANAAA